MFCLIIESISSFFWRTRIARHLQHTTDHCPLFLLSWNSQIFQISENYLPCAKNTKNASNARIEADITCSLPISSVFLWLSAAFVYRLHIIYSRQSFAKFHLCTTSMICCVSISVIYPLHCLNSYHRPHTFPQANYFKSSEVAVWACFRWY